MPLNRSAFRNTLFYDATNPEVVLGGFRQNGSITEANFLSILEILIFAQGKPLRVQARISDYVVTPNDVLLAVGEYDIYCDGPIQVTNEARVERAHSFSISGREDSFRHGIRSRDGKCVISGFPNSDYQILLGMWGGFETAHIFPLKHESLWVDKGYASWITDLDGHTGSKIN
ncbi:hypothetical protein HOY80DRAFT_1138309 [Tuber brumale]|nr:hypothetical protein HOY80DRAFT_1138309 [Tuber brumale]